jgi:hypothetical protein
VTGTSRSPSRNAARVVLDPRLPAKRRAAGPVWLLLQVGAGRRVVRFEPRLAAVEEAAAEAGEERGERNYGDERV